LTLVEHLERRTIVERRTHRGATRRTDVSVTGELSESLAELSGEYSCRLNMLLDEGREDLAVRLADDFERDVLHLLGGA
jgi:hypothetical protein